MVFQQSRPLPFNNPVPWMQRWNEIPIQTLQMIASQCHWKAEMIGRMTVQELRVEDGTSLQDCVSRAFSTKSGLAGPKELSSISSWEIPETSQHREVFKGFSPRITPTQARKAWFGLELSFSYSAHLTLFTRGSATQGRYSTPIKVIEGRSHLYPCYADWQGTTYVCVSALFGRVEFQHSSPAQRGGEPNSILLRVQLL